jgi:DNA-binding transcriptional regulator YbjK
VLDRRVTVLEAAVDVLAHGGARELTHRAVDRSAGLPQGSTSNVFRSRRALVDAVLGHVSARERDVLAGMPAPAAPVTAATLLALATVAVTDAIGPGRRYSIARRALFLDAAVDAESAARLRAASEQWWRTVTELLAAAGAPQAEARGRLVLAYVDGVIADQLARPQDDFDARAALWPAVWGMWAPEEPR